MHKRMATEDERVVIHSCDRRGSGSADVSENGFTGSIGTNATEVGIVEGWLSVFVESGMFGCDLLVEVQCGRGIPGYAEAINVE